MKELINILKKFEDERAKKKNGIWDANAVAKCFEDCAKEILCNGYFLVNNTYIIDLGAIELYYHEEEGSIKDHIMYHTNEHPSKSKAFEKNGNKYPYFNFGSFNLHQSGVDVTFENEGQHYRASFLIRSYRVFKKEEEDKIYGTLEPFDKCSTHIFDDMFYEGITFDGKKRTIIKWVVFDKKCSLDPKRYPRVNVAEYDNNKQKVVANITDEEYKNSGDKYFKQNSIYYKRESRLWQFKRQNITEQ